MNHNELTVILYFLKAGYSTRKLDKKLGFSSAKSKGWKSWEILKKYNLTNDDKGKLFIYTEQQSKKIIKEIPKLNNPGIIDILITANRPKNIEKYKDSFLLTDSEISLERILSGETRNIIRNFFLPQKRIVRKCQYKNCNQTKLDTCHYKNSRPENFKLSANKFKKDLNGLYMFDLYKIFKDFLYSHSKNKSICFLCKEHHNELGKKEKESKSSFNLYIKNIEW